jgi:hypothetical protein
MNSAGSLRKFWQGCSSFINAHSDFQFPTKLYQIIEINVYFINNNTAPALLIYCHLLMIVCYTFGGGQAYAIAKFSNCPIA